MQEIGIGVNDLVGVEIFGPTFCVEKVDKVQALVVGTPLLRR